MQCTFSEMQFVVGILSELVTCYWTPGKGWSAPTLPTQRQERDAGYDAMIDGPVSTMFFQFKVPEKITAPWGKHYRTFGGPYYKFKLWPDKKSQQHNHLIDLARKDARNKVYYCAPAFHTGDEFEENYKKKEIAKKSIYVPCGGLSSISGNDQHDICYTITPSRKFEMHSERYPIEALDVEGLIEDVKRARPYEDIHECLSRVAESFSIDAPGAYMADSAEERFYRIADQLLLRKNLHLVLLGR